MEEYAGKAGCRIHAYVLMTNQAHLLVSVQYVNRCYRRSGTLWEGRFRSCLTQEEDYLLVCQRYIELNPVRAGMVEHPAEYPWSSYRANAVFGNRGLSPVLCPVLCAGRKYDT